MDRKPRIFILASGEEDWGKGGSGFEKLAEMQRLGLLSADIVAVISNRERGGVAEKADRLSIPFFYFPGPFTAKGYQKVLHKAGYTGADDEFVILSGWIKLVPIQTAKKRLGLRTTHTVNIHPGRLPDFGGPGMHGIHVHRKTLEAFAVGKITYTEVTMHFATEKYDEGPVIFRFPVKIEAGDTDKILQARVNQAEHYFQWYIVHLVVNRHIVLLWDKPKKKGKKGNWRVVTSAKFPFLGWPKK